jgi:hypothetical protein
MHKVFLILCLGIFLLASCSVEPSKVSSSDAKEMGKKMTFFKDEQSGLCFGVIATRKSFQGRQSGLGLTEVPCEKVERFIK